MTTVKRNSRRAAQILDAATNVRAYTLNNYFTGKSLTETPMDPVAWKSGTYRETTPPRFLAGLLQVFKFAKLRDNGNGEFSLHVHSNEWYEFETTS